jgi:type III pantothenate kinase
MMQSSINLLAISIGNSRTKLGAFVDGKLTDTFALDNGKLAEQLRDSIDRTFTPLRCKDDVPVLLASVNPALTPSIVDAVTSVIGRPPSRVDVDLQIPIGRQLDREALVGEDRLLNAAAAYDVLKQACVVVDAGTAMTIDFVDGAGTFHGGAIVPGARMMLDALHQRTAQLPEVEPVAPKEAIGHNTVDAMLSGMFHGLRGTVRELTERFAEQVGSFPVVIATGGDADLLFHGYELVDRVVPDLTLMGLAITASVAMDDGD